MEISFSRGRWTVSRRFNVRSARRVTATCVLVLEMTPWGTLEAGVIDPCGNSIRFCQRIEQPRDDKAL